MKLLAASILIIFGVGLAIIFSILVMIHGWGLEPKSYGWIIGIGLVGNVVAQLIVRVAESLAKNK